MAPDPQPMPSWETFEFRGNFPRLAQQIVCPGCGRIKTVNHLTQCERAMLDHRLCVKVSTAYEAVYAHGIDTERLTLARERFPKPWIDPPLPLELSEQYLAGYKRLKLGRINFANPIQGFEEMGTFMINQERQFFVTGRTHLAVYLSKPRMNARDFQLPSSLHWVPFLTKEEASRVVSHHPGWFPAFARLVLVYHRQWVEAHPNGPPFDLWNRDHMPGTTLALANKAVRYVPADAVEASKQPVVAHDPEERNWPVKTWYPLYSYHLLLLLLQVQEDQPALYKEKPLVHEHPSHRAFFDALRADYSENRQIVEECYARLPSSQRPPSPPPQEMDQGTERYTLELKPIATPPAARSGVSNRSEAPTSEAVVVKLEKGSGSGSPKSSIRKLKNPPPTASGKTATGAAGQTTKSLPSHPKKRVKTMLLRSAPAVEEIEDDEDEEEGAPDEEEEEEEEEEDEEKAGYDPSKDVDAEEEMD